MKKKKAKRVEAKAWLRENAGITSNNYYNNNQQLRYY
jgi:hypothetical protein